LVNSFENAASDPTVNEMPVTEVKQLVTTNNKVLGAGQPQKCIVVSSHAGMLSRG